MPLFTPCVLHSACLVQNKVFFISRKAAAGDFTTSPALGLSPKGVTVCLVNKDILQAVYPGKKNTVQNYLSHQELFKGALKYSPSITQTSQPWQGCLMMLLAFCKGDTQLCRLHFCAFYFCSDMR